MFRTVCRLATAAACFATLACTFAQTPVPPATVPAATATAPAAAPAATAEAAKLAIAESDSGKTLTVALNTTVTISLAGNATTGYSWSVTKIEGAAVEQVGNIQYVTDPAPPRMVGVGGTSVAKFRAAKAGQSTITLGYARPWEQNTPPIKTFTVTLTVQNP
jgi:inhibitor of cysteine peptidase